MPKQNNKNINELKINISFVFSVSGSGLLEVAAFAQGVKLFVQLIGSEYRGKFKGTIPDNSILTIRFVMRGPNGTPYNINYDCKREGQSVQDPQKLPPVKGDITGNNQEVETIQIKI